MTNDFFSQGVEISALCFVLLGYSDRFWYGHEMDIEDPSERDGQAVLETKRIEMMRRDKMGSLMKST